MVTSQLAHHRVVHPRELLAAPATAVSKTNYFLLSHLAVVFGLAETVWIFAAVTIAAYWFPAGLQAKIFFFSSGCIQLFALPLLTYIGNRQQTMQQAAADAQHEALTHIANQIDAAVELLRATR